MTAKRSNGASLEADTALLLSDPRWKLAERVARSPALSRATQLREMLLFIVRQAILNPDEPVHEFDIAHQVLGRRSDFSPLDDNIVRVQMAHLRKKLDLHFSTDGKHEDVIITVALGTYRPVFSPRSQSTPHVLSQEAEADQSADIAAESIAPGEGRPSRRNALLPRTRAGIASHKSVVLPLVGALAILILACACMALWIRLRDTRQALTAARQSLSPWKAQPSLAQLWSNFFDAGHDTDIVLSDDTYLLVEQISKQTTPFYSYLNRTYLEPSQSTSAGEQARFIQNMIATKSLGSISEFKLAQRILALDPVGRNIHLFSARQYMPALLKQDNVILIGGRVSNPWVELFENRLNFIENTKFEGFGMTTVTNRAPAPGEPSLYTSTDSVGYCVVAFLPNPGRDREILLIEGTSAEATEAAGDFVAGEQFQAFRGMLHSSNLPFFEVLLKTSQVRGTPLTVTVEAYRVYPGLH